MRPAVSLRRYLLMQFAIVAALPVVIISVLVWQFLIPQMRTNINLQQRSLAGAIAGQISAHLNGGQRTLAALAEFLATELPPSDTELTALMDALCADGTFFETIFFIPRGETHIHHVGLARLRRHKREDLLGLDISGRRFFDGLPSAEKSVWSQTFLSTVSGRLAVALTVPARDGMIVGEMALDQLSASIRHLPAAAGRFTLVLDSQGRIVADSQRTRWGQILNMESLLLETGGRLIDRDSLRFHLDGAKLVGTLLPIQDLGWRVLVAQPVDTAFKPLRDAFVLMTIGLAIAVVIALAAAWQRAGGLSRIVNAYAGRARAIAEGRYEHTWPALRTAEFVHLANNLETMANKIRQRETELLDSETHLRTTLNSIGDAVIATDARGRVTQMNPMAETITGWPWRDALNRPLGEVFRIVHGLTREPVETPVDEVIARGETVGPANHTLLVSRDGREYQIARSAAPIRYADGRIVGVVLVFRDVTEAYAQAQRIRDNERRLSNLVANIPGVVYQYTPSARSPRAGEFLSIVPDKVHEILGLRNDMATFDGKFAACIPEAERPRFAASLNAALEAPGPWDYEGRFVKPTGEAIWLSCHSVPHRVDGRTIYYGVMMDISTRKRMESSLRLTQFCFDKASVGIFRIGRDGAILDVNEQACRSLGYTHEELCRLSVFDIDPDYTPPRYAELMANLRSKGSQTIETRHRRKNGEAFPIQIRLNAMRYEGQEFLVAFVEDITERKKTLEEMQRLRNYLSNIIDSMPSMLVGVGVDGRVTQWNRQAERATGLPFDKARGQHLTDVFPRLKNDMNRITAAIRNRETIRKTKIPRQADGATRFEDVTIYPLVANGVEGAVIRVDDVTERVRLEEMMIQSEKMLSVGGLAAGMAHEINNPLAGILQNAAVLENRLLGDLPANHSAAGRIGTSMAVIRQYIAARRLVEMLDNIRTSGQRAADIVRNMLSFARKSDRLVSTQDLRALLDQTLDLVKTDYDMKKRYDFKKIDIVKAYDAQPVFAPCEASKIQQVFLNILKNGAEAMGQDGAAVNQPRFILRVSSAAPWACVEIEDNGPGIPDAVRRRVFEPFFTTKPVGRGTGLGLSVSYFIITENHGGEMQVLDVDGGGTRFVVRLPMEGPPAAR